MKTPLTTVALLLTTLLFLAASSPALHAANVGPEPANPQKLADDYAPWISAVILQKWNVANRLYPMSNRAQSEVQSSNFAQTFARFTKLDQTPLTLIGARSLGQGIGTLLFTATTDDGPVAFKISYFTYDGQTHIGKLEIADRWTEIETLYNTIDPLQSPATATLQSRPQ